MGWGRWWDCVGAVDCAAADTPLCGTTGGFAEARTGRDVVGYSQRAFGYGIF